MKQAMISYVQNQQDDEIYTPEEAIIPLLKYIDSSKTIWEPTDPGNSKITEVLQRHGNKVIATHIDRGVDYLTSENTFEHDLIITNPPYSLKTQFLRQAYRLGKPFALLLPITALEGVERGKLYREYGLQVLVLDRRINFLKQKRSCWFNTSWFCWKLLPQDLLFAEI